MTKTELTQQKLINYLKLKYGFYSITIRLDSSGGGIGIILPGISSRELCEINTAFNTEATIYPSDNQYRVDVWFRSIEE